MRLITSTLIRRSILLLGWLVVAGPGSAGNGPRDLAPDRADQFVQVSPTNPRYLQFEDGTPFIPIGTSISWSRTTVDPTEALAQYRKYFKNFAENGGNVVRIWLSAPLFEIETVRPMDYDSAKVRSLHAPLVELAGEYGIKLKFCIENFRLLQNRPAPFIGSVPFDKPIYHQDAGGPFTEVSQYFTSREGRQIYLSKLQFYANLFGDNPSVFGWELWNEFNSVSIPRDLQLSWTADMLAEARKIFPRHLVMQTTGSYDSMLKRELYQAYHNLPGNDIAQVHRYLDLGSDWFVTKGPMDILVAEAIRDFRSMIADKPVILSETGAVEPRHTGPWKLYDQDREGVVLHDALFAAFFAGSAGSGQNWHWHHYIEKHDLWWHFGRFERAVAGLNPLVEDFAVNYRETAQTRNYILNGNRTMIAWLRDVDSDWETELVDGAVAQPIKDLTLGRAVPLPANVQTIECFLPWADEWITVERSDEGFVLPTFTRSIVVKADLTQRIEIEAQSSDDF